MVQTFPREVHILDQKWVLTTENEGVCAPVCQATYRAQRDEELKAHV
jgi:hypothetical protein